MPDSCIYCQDEDPECVFCHDAPDLGLLADPDTQPLEPWLIEED
jgi:hypothetical protein